MNEGSDWAAEREERVRKRAERDAMMGELRRLCAGVPVRVLALYLAERMGCTGNGQYRVEFHVADGSVRRPFLHRGPMREEELEELDAAG